MLFPPFCWRYFSSSPLFFSSSYTIYGLSDVFPSLGRSLLDYIKLTDILSVLLTCCPIWMSFCRSSWPFLFFSALSRCPSFLLDDFLSKAYLKPYWLWWGLLSTFRFYFRCGFPVDLLKSRWCPLVYGCHGLCWSTKLLTLFSRCSPKSRWLSSGCGSGYFWLSPQLMMVSCGSLKSLCVSSLYLRCSTLFSISCSSMSYFKISLCPFVVFSSSILSWLKVGEVTPPNFIRFPGDGWLSSASYGPV